MIKAAWGEDGGCSAPARNGKKGFGMQGMGSDPAGAPSLLPVSHRQELQQPLGYLWGQKPPQPLSGVGTLRWVCPRFSGAGLGAGQGSCRAAGEGWDKDRDTVCTGGQWEVVAVRPWS